MKATKSKTLKSWRNIFTLLLRNTKLLTAEKKTEQVFLKDVSFVAHKHIKGSSATRFRQQDGLNKIFVSSTNVMHLLAMLMYKNHRCSVT